MEQLISRLDNIVYLIGSEATHFGAEVTEEIISALYEVRECLLEDKN